MNQNATTRRNVLMIIIAIISCAWNVTVINTRVRFVNNAVITWNAFMADVNKNQREVQVREDTFPILSNETIFFLFLMRTSRNRMIIAKSFVHIEAI